MSVYIFLWSAWVLVILLVCFLNKKVHTGYACHVLLIIFLSQFFIPYGVQEINVAFLYMIVMCCFYIGKLSFKLKVSVIMTSLIVALVNGCMHIFSSLEPLWFSWMPGWIPAAVVIYTVMVLQKGYAGRQLTLLMGICFGDVLLAFAYGNSWMHYSLFSPALLNLLALGSLFLVVWTLAEKALGNMAGYQHSHKKEI